MLTKIFKSITDFAFTKILIRLLDITLVLMTEFQVEN